MIQIDIEMPKSCADCPLCHCKGKDDPWNYYCSITMDDINIEEWDNIRYNTCPLKEVPTGSLTEPCEDAISRQWLMECVNEGWIKFDTEKDNNRFIHLVRDMAPPAQSKTWHWIPVSERMPEEDGQYLITVKYKHVNDSYEDVYAEYGELYDGRWDMFCFGHCGEVEEIIAWMPYPLPAPYEPQAESEVKE